MEIKINEISSEKLLLGAHVIELTDESRESFTTNDLFDFVEWLRKYKKESTCETLVIEYDDKTLTAHDKLQSTNPRYNQPIIQCNLTTHPRLALITAFNNNWKDISAFEDILMTLKPNFADPAAIELIGHLRDFRVSKITNIVRQRDPRTGDFAFSVSRKSAATGKEIGLSDFEPPHSLAFDIPIFEGSPDSHRFEFEFAFDYSTDDGECELKFKLRNISLLEQIKEARKKTIQAYVASIDIPSFWGQRSTKAQTNEWMFKRNNA